MAIVLCLLIMSTLCLIGGAALSVSGLNRKIVHNVTKQAQAFYIAEAGREMALARLRQDPLFRGDEDSSYQGGVDIGVIRGTYFGTFSDCTDDENGIYIAQLLPGHVMVSCLGTYLDAVQTLSCLVSMTPEGTDPAMFPQKAVISAGDVTGPVTTLNNFGVENSSLILADTPLPDANITALRAFADLVFPSLDNETYDAALGGISSFWRDHPADTRPHIVYVQGNLNLSGERRLYGIIFVAGDRVALSGKASVHGILYAPYANGITVVNTGDSGRLVGMGQFAAGPGGVRVTGNQVTVQLHYEYIDSFNEAAGSEIEINMVSGSWRPF